LLLHAIVHRADIQDRDGGILLLATLFGMYPFLKKLFADGGYQGPEFQKALAKIMPKIEAEIVKRSDQTKGFVVLPRRWIVERTIAWLNRCRRLAKDWENLNRKALAFLRLASIRLMLRKLCNPASCSRTDSNEKGPGSRAFLPASPMHTCSGIPMYSYSDVDRRASYWIHAFRAESHLGRMVFPQRWTAVGIGYCPAIVGWMRATLERFHAVDELRIT